MSRRSCIIALIMFVSAAGAAAAFGIGHVLADHLEHLGEADYAQVKARFSDGDKMPENQVSSSREKEPLIPRHGTVASFISPPPHAIPVAIMSPG